MDKLRFDFKICVEDSKTNVLCITSIGTTDGRNYAIPDMYQRASLHTQVIKTSAYNKVENSISKRNQIRRVWINLNEDLAATYLDEGGNLQFEDIFLEEKLEDQLNVSVNASDQPLIKALEKLLEKSGGQTSLRNIGGIADKFTIEKFDGRTSSADQWITGFEKECERFQISVDENKIEILKSFMDKGAMDWYSCTLMKLTIESKWEIWRESFCKTFTGKGWSSIRFAFSFKYQKGSLLEYAIKKEKLLLEARNSIDSGTLIDLIATGLPNFVINMIDRGNLKIVEDLYNELGKLEHLVYKKNFEKKNDKYHSNKENTVKSPCEICKNEDKGIRFHPTAECWFKKKKERMQHVNNSTLEVEFNNTDPKN
ncbi:uncharacterized protein LOC123678478 [Harmonia axyridis]|uniref:uncharacterized protein LOC123678478 n=1 Tax=Harmonia axyridis TaxID=115357 RepID=UPI001E275C0E|nr:uncharacterized protein LOC123678478 [Harmonia axyridis]